MKARVGQPLIAGEQPLQSRRPRAHLAEDDHRRAHRPFQYLRMRLPQSGSPHPRPQRHHDLPPGHRLPERIEVGLFRERAQQHPERLAPLLALAQRGGRSPAQRCRQQLTFRQHRSRQRAGAPRGGQRPICSRDQRETVGGHRFGFSASAPGARQGVDQAGSAVGAKEGQD
jgi:hypothetical protein